MDWFLLGTPRSPVPWVNTGLQRKWKRCLCLCALVPVRLGKARVGWFQLKTAHFTLSSVCSGLTPPKRSRGKPALSRVPFLEGVNGDSDHSGSGEETMEAELGETCSEEQAVWAASCGASQPGCQSVRATPTDTDQRDGLHS